MESFWISDIVEKNGEKILYINPLPGKYCTFDCVFCPIGERTIEKTEKSCRFMGTDTLLQKIRDIMSSSKVDKLYILPDGEGLLNAGLEEVIQLAKEYGSKIRIITNGYILNHPAYKSIMLQCDEVIGELMTVTEEDFQTLQRPLQGYSLNAYIESMVSFRKDFKGVFDLSITLLKNYSDSDIALHYFQDAVKKLNPDNVFIETPDEGKLKEAFGVDEEIMERFRISLCSVND